MNSKIYSYLFLFLLAIGTTACTDGFEELNTNPNAPIEVQPSLLLRQVIYDYGEEMSYEGFVAGNLLGQYFTAIDFNLFDRHSLTEPQFGGNPWPIIYTNLRDNNLILDQVEKNAALEVYEGPALILKAYFTMALTDLFGDVPYSESLQGAAGNVTPTYDNQEAIYNGIGGIFSNLNAGINALEAYQGSIPLEGDILFNGDLSAWVRFANSLKIKAYLRISAKADVATPLQAVYDSGAYLNTNEQNAAFDFNDGQPNNFRMANLRAGDFNLFIMSETIEEILTTLDDPRRAVWFRPMANDPTAYAGLLNGPDASQTSISVADYSLSGAIFRERTGDLDANFLTAWETHFLLAEAAEKGLIVADARGLYELAVQQAFEYWQTPLPSAYLTDGPAAYGATGNAIEQIITQKWLANIVNGYEGWTEYRRTGFPVLKTISASLNNNLIPTRLPYPTEEAALNPANYNTAAAATDGNSVNSLVWWDIN